MPKLISFTIVLIAIILLGSFLMLRERKTAEPVVVENAAPHLEEIPQENAAPDIASSPLPEQPQATPAPQSDATETNTSEEKMAGSASGPKMTDWLLSSGFTVKNSRAIDAIVLHSSYDANGSDPYSVSGVIKEYTDAGVSAHYLIDRKGTIYRLVEEKNIAYHAGVSKMPDGRTNVNDFSIGIEMINTMDGNFTSAQYNAVNDLIAYLKKKYTIKNIVGHSDIAPGRKTDPWNFDWKKLK